MEYKKTSKCEQETLLLAQNIEAEKFPNMVICLQGNLGSGKTTFTQGFAMAMGIEDNITSPTFTIIKEYQGELPLYHMDVYRINGDIDGLGLEEYFSKDGVVIIEWSDLIKQNLPEERLEITFKIVDEVTRVIILKPYGLKYEEICEAII